MAWRLNDLVVEGELLNTRYYSTHGWLGLRGQDRPLRLELTGNCDPDLKGWHIRFTTRPAAHTHVADDDPAADLSGLAWDQIGPTGTITAARKVRVSDCPPEEMYIRATLGEMPPTEWKRSLYLEWYGQNGRMVVELVDPEIEFVKFIDFDGSGDLRDGVDGRLDREERRRAAERAVRGTAAIAAADYCPACEAEFDQQYEAEQRHRQEHPELYPPPRANPPDDIPF